MIGTLALVILIGYLLGNIQTSYILGKIVARKDIRDYGSHNAGTTNALRVFGKKIAVATLLVDLLKGVAAVIIGQKLMGIDGGMFGGISAVAGHNWPVFLGFKGGKGVATTIGVALALTPLSALICIVIALLIMYKSKYVSLAAITCVTIWPIANFIIYRDGKLVVMAAILALMMIFKHKANIKRLLNGTENKLNLTKKNDQEV